MPPRVELANRPNVLPPALGADKAHEVFLHGVLSEGDDVLLRGVEQPRMCEPRECAEPIGSPSDRGRGPAGLTQGLFPLLQGEAIAGMQTSPPRRGAGTR
jgi:hypothetical protein